MNGAADPMLVVEALGVAYSGRHASGFALRRLDLDVARGEIFVLLGPSGCGKTTLLRAVAGLHKPTEGRIAIGGRTVSDAVAGRFVPAEDRPVSMVFQSYALWPHMDVTGNIAFPLKRGRRGTDAAEADRRVADVLGMLSLSDYARRPVTMLSGGQQQRVALARALALRPDILLMDEPLSNLDYELQVRLRGEIRDMVASLGLTTIYVTHNQTEALEIADRMAVMDAGRICQVGTPRDIYHRPNCAFVARFIGETNLIEARLLSREAAGAGLVETPWGRLRAAWIDPGLEKGAHCLLAIRREDVVLCPEPGDGNVVTMTLERAKFSGDAVLYGLSAAGLDLLARAPGRSEPTVGETMPVGLPVEHCLVLAAEADGPGSPRPEADR